LSAKNKSDQVVIAGAGPVGLTAAYALLRHGIPVTLLESYADVPTDPRASTFHPPTMELLESLDVAQEVHGMGIEVPKWQFRDLKKGLVAEFDLAILGDITRYPFRLHCEQHKYAQMLLSKVEKMDGCEIRKSRNVTGVHSDGWPERPRRGCRPIFDWLRRRQERRSPCHRCQLRGTDL